MLTKKAVMFGRLSQLNHFNLHSARAAMFGLEDRALRKQSGGLFLAKLRRLTFRLVEGHQATRVKTQSGAMFGLDARIALAIFGALSVISGAALYSAIQQSQATALLTEMTEVGKAWESHYVDTGAIPSKFDDAVDTASGFYVLNVNNLVTNTDSLANWQGPYVTYSEDSSLRLNGNSGEFIYLLTLNDKATWGDGTTTSWSSAGHCGSSDTCYMWVSFNRIDSLALVKKVDELVDGSVDGDAGDFRWYYENTTYKHNAILKIAPIPNPHG